MIRTVRFPAQRIPAALLVLTILLAIFQLFPRLAGAERISMNPDITELISFRHDTAAYIFGLDPAREYNPAGGTKTPDNNAANWWVINSDPKTGFRSVVKDAAMSSKYDAVTSFELNSHPYIFGLHQDVGANIWRINDDPSTGFKLVMYKGKMAGGYSHVVSFQLKGQPYILGLHHKVGANIWRIQEGPKGLTFNLVKYKAPMSPNYEHLAVFYMDKHPYIFGLHKDVGANIWRIKDDPSQGLDLVMYGAKFSHDYDFVLPFHLGDRPYLLGVVSKNYIKRAIDVLEGPATPDPLQPGGVEAIVRIADILVEMGKGYGCIWEIKGAPNSMSIRKISKSIPISHNYTKVTTFEQAGKAYIFGIHREKYANIWRVQDDPAQGFTLEYYGRNK